jgi:sulfur-oxidizing protein SoxY
MSREVTAWTPGLSRRSFLALASAAAGVSLLPPSRGRAAGAAGDAPSRPDPQEHTLQLRVPPRTANGAKVPIVVESPHPMTPGHHVTSVRVANDGDPISCKGTFHLTPANGRVYVAFQARMHEGASSVSATAECNLHGSFSASSPIEIPEGAGGCMGGGPATLGRTPGEDVHAPVIRVAELVERGALRRDEIVHVQLKMRHPNRTGLAYRDGRFVQESEPIHLDAIEVLYGGAPASRFELTSALSDDPLITFALAAGRGGKLEIVVTNSRGQRFHAAEELRVS